jgi:hypothetical protein
VTLCVTDAPAAMLGKSMNTVRRSTTGPYLGDAMLTLFPGIRHRPLRNKARQGDQGDPSRVGTLAISDSKPRSPLI